MGGELRQGEVEQTWTIPPGEVTVACLPDERSSYSDPGVPTAVFTVVDPDGLYVPWDLACGFGDRFRITIEAARGEDPPAVIRRVPGVLPSDELRKPGYPRSAQMWPTFNLFRDGRYVARIACPLAGTSELLVNACPGSGIEPPPTSAGPSG